MESSNVFTLFAFILCAVLALSLLPSPSAARNLIINDISFRNINCPVVYEIPDDDGKADAIRHIERVRDRVYPGGDIIDAATADDSMLKEKLADGFTLFTTISDTSRLFKATTEPLSIRIEEGILNWNGLSAPIGKLQVIAVGKNPYGDGYCVVFAAGSNELLVNVDSFHGHCSYHIFQEGKPFADGYYREDFTIAKDRISSAEAEADVKQFFLTLQRVHPDLLAKVSVDDYIKLKQQITEDIVKQSTEDGEISVNELANMLFYAAAFFGDGHTSVHWRFQPNESNTVGIRFPPFLLGCDNGRFVILASSYNGIDGMEIISVNDKPVREFFSSILDRCSGETFAFRAARFTGDQSFWYAFCKPYGSDKILTLKLANAAGEEVVREVATVGLTDFQKILSDWKVGKQRKTQRQGTRVEFLDSGVIAHFIYPQFTFSDYEKKMVDNVFEEIKANKSREVIIDLRGNGGGNSSMGDIIFSYLYDEPFFTFQRVV